MSHPEQMAFFQLLSDANSHLLSGSKVLEIGSYDVNGSTRKVFAPAGTYVGVDLTEGPGVDVVSFGHELDHPEGMYDLVLSAECFEHDPFWKRTFANMTRLCRAQGVVTFTCAGAGRPEHGTRRTSMEQSPGTQASGYDYYRNLNATDFEDAFDLNAMFERWRFWSNPTSFDLYFVGVRSGNCGDDRLAHFPEDASVKALARLMPFRGRALRFPLRLVRSAVNSEATYQNVIRPYWRVVQAVHKSRASP